MENFLDNFEDFTIPAGSYMTPEESGNILRSQEGAVIMHLNIRSIDKHYEELQILLARINYNIDVIICTETRKLVSPEFYEIDGYQLHYNYGSATANDGVVAYVREDYEHETKIENIGEVSVLQINLPSRTLKITAVYRSPSTREEHFIENLYNYLVENEEGEHIFIGDINIDIMKHDRMSKDYLNALYGHGFQSAINLATRKQAGSVTCIDHIFIRTQKENDILIPMIIVTEVESYTF